MAMFFMQKKIGHVSTSFQLIESPTEVKGKLSSTMASDEKKGALQKECKTFPVTLIKKLQEESPLKYALIINASSLSPSNKAADKEVEVCIARFDNICDSIYQSRSISGSTAAAIVCQSLTM